MEQAFPSHFLVSLAFSWSRRWCDAGTGLRAWADVMTRLPIPGGPDERTITTAFCSLGK
jgi:hypothetical protein